MEYWKSENGLLQRKVKKLLRKARRQYHVIREQDSKLEAREAEALGIHDAQETKTKVIKKLDYETRELRAVLELVQDEKKKALGKACTEGEGVKIKDYTSLEKELENLKKDCAAEIKELIYLRWSNACLRHELIRNQAQLEQQAQEKDNKLEIKFEGGAEIGNYEQCFGNMSSDQEHPKRKKLFRRLKRWKERHGQVKCFGRHSVSNYAEEHHIARKSCSSARTHNIRL
ncbi:protein CHUP1 [Pyrus ussuriensis x Pyrus communis]|uniref:Protein CHUP1 n=1 Tax=Pyrus ussuriensis x Pyrus communis TaxID=2448454 RepID=A0A5N5I5W3_9ROSA|nr:protein CHUP1 [Pyrus ussuriensis x Pyrus communis]